MGHYDIVTAVEINTRTTWDGGVGNKETPLRSGSLMPPTASRLGTGKIAAASTKRYLDAITITGEITHIHGSKEWDEPLWGLYPRLTLLMRVEQVNWLTQG